MKFSGVTILQGVEFSIFPIDFEWALQQCRATALPVISLTVILLVYLCHVNEHSWYLLTYLLRLNYLRRQNQRAFVRGPIVYTFH